MPVLTLEHRETDGVVVLDLIGCLTAESRTAVSDAVREVFERRGSRLVLNLTQVTDVDAAGLGQIAESRRLATMLASDVRLVLCDGPIKEPLARTRLLGLFCVFPSESDALASFRAVSFSRPF